MRPSLAREAQRIFQLSGAASCLLAIFLAAGGHWAFLQSVAYTRMVVQFAQEDSLGTAVRKAFDSQHSCSLCPRIRDGYNKERKVPPSIEVDRLPEFIGDQGSGSLFFAVTTGIDLPFLSSTYDNFAHTPPKPPPRVV